ncbi:MAG: STAS domain-containing protein [Myxococcales bacterium]|nr:STAS domain-containing protein [Myxococcales bacterium]MCB9579264.1 STAS domain-containing protein [Polyangiaceae bacterium]
MTFALTQDLSDGVMHLTLSGQADIARAWDLRAALTEALSASDDVILTLEVERMDAAGVQLVIAAKRWVEARGGRASIETGDGAARAALAAAGVLDLLDEDAEGETR